MILVVSEQLSLRFVLQHPGKSIHMAQTATAALRILRNGTHEVEGVVLDERITNSRLVTGYMRSHVPNVPLVSFQIAQRSSPFSTVPINREAAARAALAAKAQGPDASRFILEPRLAR